MGKFSKDDVARYSFMFEDVSEPLKEYRVNIDGSLHEVVFRPYFYQPVEIDARNYADGVMKRLEEKEIV